jgi:hypothetical protein
MEDWGNFIRCESQNLALNSLSAMSKKAESNLNSLVKSLETECGVCDITGSSFIQKIEAYIKIELSYYTYDQLIELFLGERVSARDCGTTGLIRVASKCTPSIKL